MDVVANMNTVVASERPMSVDDGRPLAVPAGGIHEALFDCPQELLQRHVNTSWKELLE
ncbi:hypothetical protein HG15A2_14820 [Adhaeretor mobilis]|uniref:Uncharacterized protein n=2 Tax=Adhaeretor mobilis TaxID=1930276 RepID=A0A517MTJ5_9BACT|nr:hypothetical protein HG15A2_14820 [Adhaeretor mobilis]